MTKPMVDHLMVQEQIKAPHRKWKHMVAVMCLNLTYPDIPGTCLFYKRKPLRDGPLHKRAFENSPKAN